MILSMILEAIRERTFCNRNILNYQWTFVFVNCLASRWKEIVSQVMVANDQTWSAERKKYVTAVVIIIILGVTWWRWMLSLAGLTRRASFCVSTWLSWELGETCPSTRSHTTAVTTTRTWVKTTTCCIHAPSSRALIITAITITTVNPTLLLGSSPSFLV